MLVMYFILVVLHSNPGANNYEQNFKISSEAKGDKIPDLEEGGGTNGPILLEMNIKICCESSKTEAGIYTDHHMRWEHAPQSLGHTDTCHKM